MLLVVDVGNTKVSFGMFEDGALRHTAGFLHCRTINLQVMESVISSVFLKHNIDSCIISSVADDLTDIVRQSILNVLHINPYILSPDFDLGIKIKSNNPKQYGLDRIANAYAASKLYKERPIIVVDSGTATTFDIIDEKDYFIGGIILPGLQTQLNALEANTSKLPKLTLDMMEDVDKIINSDTPKAILSGVVNGHAQAIQGLIVKCERELRKRAFVIGTGGDAELLNKYMKYKKFNCLNPFLTLEGIHMIYDLNIQE